MVKIQPFQALRYNDEKIEDLSLVMAPPYDVIGPNKRRQLYEQSPYNIALIDLPEEVSGQDKYQVAAQQWKQWRQEGVIVQDQEPSIYLYFQTYQLPSGEEKIRRGFFVRRRIETFEEGGVKPHERTFAGPKADRLKLTQATHTNLSPIFSLFSDESGSVSEQLSQLSQRPADWQLKAESGEHRVWRISNGQEIQHLLASLTNSDLMIADGHHRYETAVNYCQQRKAELGSRFTGEEPFNYVMMYFCAFEDPGLVVLPTHRILNQLPDQDSDSFYASLEKYAKISRFSMSDFSKVKELMNQLEKEGHGLAWLHEGQIDLLEFDLSKVKAHSPVLKGVPEALIDLDVSLLHAVVLEEVMGVSQEAQRQYETIQYVKNDQDLIRMTQEKNSYGFLMNPTSMAQMEAVTHIGATMPQKSTFFYPKLLTGLTFYDLGE